MGRRKSTSCLSRLKRAKLGNFVSMSLSYPLFICFQNLFSESDSREVRSSLFSHFFFFFYNFTFFFADNEEGENCFEERQWPDGMLYQHFSNKFDKLVETYGRDRMAKFVVQLQRERRRLEKKCQKMSGRKHVYKGETREEIYQWCEYRRMSEKEFARLVIAKQMAKFEDWEVALFCWTFKMPLNLIMSHREWRMLHWTQYWVLVWTI